MEVALVVCGVVVFLVIWAVRTWAKAKNVSFGSKTEAIVRYALCVLLAVVTYYGFSSGKAGVWLILTLVATAFLIYGVTHFLDRLFLKE